MGAVGPQSWAYLHNGGGGGRGHRKSFDYIASASDVVMQLTYL